MYILDLPTSLLLNFKQIKQKTQNLDKLIESIKFKLKKDPNCNFEVTEDFQQIRKKGLFTNEVTCI